MSTWQTEYGRRLRLSAVCSVVVHGLVLSVAGWHGFNHSAGLGVSPEPIVVNLQRPQPEPAQRLVDTYIPAEEPVVETDLISDVASKAADPFDMDGAREAPFFKEPAEFDQLAKVELPDVPPPPSVETRQPAAEPPTPAEPLPELTALQPREVEAQVPQTPEQAPYQVAQATPPEMPELPSGEPKGRVDGGVKGAGFIGFEAMQNEFAPYLKEVRSRVEKHWRMMLTVQYAGVTPTQAVVDCAIRPDGHLARASVAEAGDTVGYAAICKEAIERAAPFPPFPFDVPEMYRSKNLEIRWTFSFLSRR